MTEEIVFAAEFEERHTIEVSAVDKGTMSHFTIVPPNQLIKLKRLNLQIVFLSYKSLFLLQKMSFATSQFLSVSFFDKHFISFGTT